MTISMDLHIFFLPFLAPGHMIPMVDLAKLLASRGVKSTIVTTIGNAPRIQPSLDRSPNQIQLLTLPFPSAVPDNVESLPTLDIPPEFTSGLDSLKPHFERLVVEHRPDCIVSDIYYPWSADVAVEHDIPRVAFHGSSSFAGAVLDVIVRCKPHESVADDDDPFVVPGLPHRIEMVKSQVMGCLASLEPVIVLLMEAQKKTYGNVMNTFRDMEPGYTDGSSSSKTWLVGPVSLCNRDTFDRAARGGGNQREHEYVDECLNWLDSKKPRSVLYVCFGSLGQFTTSQLVEIATGLKSSDHPFIWVVRNVDDASDWFPEGFGEKGLIIKGWAPQTVILDHQAVGGFLTHCGWNSCLEGTSSGVPMITWPLFAEQFFNERLLVDVLGVGFAVGSKVCSNLVENRTIVSREEVKKAIEEVMGSGEGAEERRNRAREVAVMAKRTMEEGGSSCNDLSNMLRELEKVKAAKIESAKILSGT